MKWFAGFASVCWLLLSSNAAAEEQWHQATTDNFVVTGDADKRTIRQLALELEEFRSFLGVFLPGKENTEPRAIRVFLMADDESFQDIVGLKNVAGVFTYRIEEGIFVANAAKNHGYSVVSTQKRDRGRYAREILKHEYVHHFVYKAGPSYYPHWYNEGFAEYLSTFEGQRKSGIIGTAPTGPSFQLAVGRNASWEDVFGSVYGWTKQGSRPTANEVRAMYAQAWLATHFFMHHPEYHQALGRYMAGVRAYPDRAEEIFEGVFEMSYAEMGVVLDNYEKKNAFPRSKLDMSSFREKVEPTLTRLDGWETRLVKADAQSFFSKSREERDAVESRYKDLHAERASDVRPLAALALMTFRRGADEDAKAYAAKLKALDPDGVWTLIMDAKLADLPDRLEPLQKARLADPLNPLAHFDFADAKRQLDQFDDDALAAAEAAMELSPDPYAVQLLAGEIMAEVGDHAEAEKILSPVVAWAPFPAHRKTARETLARIGTDD